MLRRRCRSMKRDSEGAAMSTSRPMATPTSISIRVASSDLGARAHAHRLQALVAAW
jgi:hypothetical protein